MIFRPTGLIAFTELNVERLFEPKYGAMEGAEDATA
jgi:hypothetical protein